LRQRLNSLVLVALTIVFGLGLSGAVAADTRVAFVVGNGAYRNVPPLPNPRNDAADVTAKVKALGFQTFGGVDLDRAAIMRELTAFGRAAENADVAMVFYAGHGLQLNGQNYLVPVDANVEYEAEADIALVPFNLVMQQLNRGSRINIALLDACRDNPFAKTLSRTMGTRAVELQRGLSRAPTVSGSFIAYSTQPDNVAVDGSGRNSPFTAALLKNIDTPNLSLPDLMIMVRKQVMADTNGKQVPWDSSSLTGQFSFKIEGTITITPQGAQTTIAPAAPSSVDSRTLELGVWNAIRDSDDVAAFEKFLKDFPDGVFSTAAAGRIAKLKQPAAAAPTSVAAPAPVSGVIQLAAADIVMSASRNVEVGGANMWGEGVVHNGPPYVDQPDEAEWRFQAETAGAYKLEAQYAAGESRPVQIYVNGALAIGRGLSATTGGWTPEFQKWTPQGTVRLNAGQNVLRFARTSYFPHIQGVRMTLTEGSEPARAAPPAGFEGRWSTTWGDMTFQSEGARVVAQYPLRNGRIYLSPEAAQTFDGIWTQSVSDQRCDAPREGSDYWGKISLSFRNGSFIGKWSRCDAEMTAAIRGVAPAKTVASQIAGAWSSNWGDMQVRVSGSNVEGSFKRNNGRLEGKLTDGVFVGTWMQSSADQACAQEVGGTSYWGKFRMQFADDRFVGQWGYCGFSLDRQNWYGEKRN
jgi:hypothetical protein